MVQFMRILFFYCTKKVNLCGKICCGRSSLYTSKCTRTNGILFSDTDFVPKNREPARDQQRPAGKKPVDV